MISRRKKERRKSKIVLNRKFRRKGSIGYTFNLVARDFFYIYILSILLDQGKYKVNATEVLIPKQIVYLN